MKRLFLTLYALIILGILVLVVSLNTISGKVLGTNDADYAKKAYSGLFVLLDDELLTSSNRDTALSNLKDLFGYSVDLISIEAFSASEKETQVLNQQGVAAPD